MERSSKSEKDRAQHSARGVRIAIASGKGGTGKTTVAANLAQTLIEKQVKVAYIDCDVEAPNGHLFFNPTIETSCPVCIPVPEIDASQCTLCGACGTACRFSALAALPNKVLTFPKLCHGCGGCTNACPVGAIRENPRPTGVVEAGRAGELLFFQGKLDIGESMAPPVIRDLLNRVPVEGTLILDAPPGTSCPVIEVVKFADAAVLVTEPTPFGLNDLKLAVEVMRTLSKPFGVVIYRADIGNDDVSACCAKEAIPVLLQIENDRRIVEAYSRGILAASALPFLKDQFLSLYDKIVALKDRDTGNPSTVAPQLQFFTDEMLNAEEHTTPFRETPTIPELVVVSGKGGTGKTGIAASLLALSQPLNNAAARDCDVDAADLHLILSPEIRRRSYFSGGKKALIDQSRCVGCGTCQQVCRFDAVQDAASNGRARFTVESPSCEGCGVCVDLCAAHAVELVPAVSGEWFVSDSRLGLFAHARLGTASENSGKLVALVRTKGREAGGDAQRSLVICDGSPGIGCPVISSLTGAHRGLIVVEPTLSGLHDMKRIAKLCGVLGVKAGVCVNKADLNLDVAAQIEHEADVRCISKLGRIRYDESVVAAQIQGLSVVEYNDGPATADIRALFEKVQLELLGAVMKG